MRYKVTRISGWGKYPAVETHLYRPERVRDFEDFPKEPSILARGLGRSYGDASLNDAGGTLLMTRMNRFIDFDDKSGILHAEAGVSFDDILQTFVPRGWFLPVTPGTKFVTLGGAIASDVHGKNHHIDGSISNFVNEIELLLADGEIIYCSPENNKDLFKATVGGNGMTGLILSAKLQLRRIRSAYINQLSIKAGDFDEAIDIFDTYDHDYSYSVAWIDCLAHGKSLGRSIVMFGNHTKVEELPKKYRDNKLLTHTHGRLNVPLNLPSFVLNSFAIRNFNRIYYGKQWKKEKKSIVHYDQFFYPLDAIYHWNRIYGKRGFLQWQCVIPLEKKESMREILLIIQKEKRGSFLAVLKKMGPREGLLSFPMQGYTLALDFQINKNVFQFLKRLDEVVVKAGGRIYLTKDARLSRENFEKMYPKLNIWKKIKKEIDQHGFFSSNQARRLGLV